VSLRRRLTLLSALAVAVAVAVASVAIYFLVRGQLRGQVDDALRERAGMTVALAERREVLGPPLGGAPADASGEAPPRAPRVLELPPPAHFEFATLGQLIDTEGAVARNPGRPAIPVTEAAKRVAAGEGGPSLLEDVSADGGELRVLTAPAGAGQALQIARPLNEVNETLADLRLLLLLVSVGGIAVAAGLGLVVARGALAPAAAVSGAAEEVARTRDLTRRIEVRGSDELGRLAASFNQMMAALETSETARRRLIADASHELRTPLATLRTNIETLGRADELGEGERDRVIADIEAELEDLSGLVGDVVELAREPEEPPPETAEVRLDELAADAVERARRRARGLRFEARLSPWMVRGDPARLDRAIWNLLDNAIKWSPAGGAVEVELAGGTIRVADQGAGFSDEDLGHAFDRFYRSDDARGKPGSGLGLAMAGRIAEQHGGGARAANAAGGGAVVELELPGEPPPEPE
jgi:two-component system sensor histidine kinase MprB